MLLPTLLTIIGSSFASFCGQAAVPFTFQVLRAGYPVLGCARPRCFGWTANGTRVADSAQFYRINGKEDGYLRRSDVLLRQPYRAEGFVPQVSSCEAIYRQNGCDAGQWIGGLAPQADAYSKTVQTRCCSYGPLFNSEDRGIAQLHPGQMVVGGEVTANNRLVAFDYIANLNKIISENGTIIYNVHVRRMQCFDDDAAEFETITANNAIIADAQRGLDKNPLDVKPSDIQLQSVQEQPPAQAMAAPTQVFGQRPGFEQQQVSAAQIDTQSQQLQSAPQPPPSPRYQPGQPQQYPQRSLPQPTQVAPQPPQQHQQQQQQQQQYNQQPQQPYYQQVQQAPQLQVLPYPQQYSLQQQYQQNGQLLQALPQQQGIQQLSPAVQSNPMNNLFPNLFPQQPQQQMINGMAQMPTLAPLKLPRLEDIPKIDIPSIEDVEHAIPPVQKAILSSVARFFGVL
ncbi:unnamed protein product, partial [Mesorhabditis belari]|uniref:Uncharacterized protein n=1 Tax=Mesorhabditis belari TaxID=2138241 RepID=A0AAF3EHW3_9BILA